MNGNLKEFQKFSQKLCKWQVEASFFKFLNEWKPSRTFILYNMPKIGDPSIFGETSFVKLSYFAEEAP